MHAAKIHPEQKKTEDNEYFIFSCYICAVEHICVTLWLK